MPKQKPKSNRRGKTSPESRRLAAETRTSEATTVAWTISVMTVLLIDVAAVLAHLYVIRNPGERGVAMLANLLLFAGAVIGFISLALLPVVYRVRREPPPVGLVVFAVCAAAAPILAGIVRAMQTQ